MNKSSIFPLKTNFSFTEFPTDIYVDTSFWNVVYGSNTNGYRPNCADFLNYCAINGTNLFVSSLVYFELNHMIQRTMFNNFAREYDIKYTKYSDGNINRKELQKKILQHDPSVLSQIDNEFQRVKSLVEKVSTSLEYTSDENFYNEVQSLISNNKYTMGTQDAQHVVISHMYGINSIATCDGDFFALDNTNIYVPPNPKYDLDMLDLNRSNTYLPFDENKY